MKRIVFTTCVVTVLALVLTTGFAITNTGEAKNLNSDRGVSVQSQAGQSEVRDLTIQLANLNARYQLSSKAERGYLLAELSSVAATRRQILSELMENDPAEVLRIALPAGFGANMPADVRENIEQRVDLTGKLEVIYACGETESHLSHFLNAGGRRLSPAGRRG